MPESVKVIVCGGRDYRGSEFLGKTLDEANALWRLSLVVEGGAPGADTLARYWAIKRNVEIRTFHANWPKHGASAGMLRNRQMLQIGAPDLVIAFPGGRGTANMMRIAREARVPVWEPAKQTIEELRIERKPSLFLHGGVAKR